MITLTKNIIAFEDELYYDAGQVEPAFFGNTRESVVKMLEEINTSVEVEREFLKSLRPSCCKIFLFIISAMLLLPLMFISCLDFYKRKQYTIHMANARHKIESVIDKYKDYLLKEKMFCIVTSDSSVTTRLQRKNYYLTFSKGVDSVPNNMMNNVIIPVQISHY
jgi:hypothetical protein